MCLPHLLVYALSIQDILKFLVILRRLPPSSPRSEGILEAFSLDLILGYQQTYGAAHGLPSITWTTLFVARSILCGTVPLVPRALAGQAGPTLRHLIVELERVEV